MNSTILLPCFESCFRVCKTRESIDLVQHYINADVTYQRCQPLPTLLKAREMIVEPY